MPDARVNDARVGTKNPDFDRDGFVIIPGVLSDEGVECLRFEADFLASSHVSTQQVASSFKLPPLRALINVSRSPFSSSSSENEIIIALIFFVQTREKLVWLKMAVLSIRWKM